MCQRKPCTSEQHNCLALKPLQVLIESQVFFNPGTLFSDIFALVFIRICTSGLMLHRNEVESQKVGKGSFAYAWVLDETGEERTRLE